MGLAALDGGSRFSTAHRPFMQTNATNHRSETICVILTRPVLWEHSQQQCRAAWPRLGSIASVSRENEPATMRIQRAVSSICTSSLVSRADSTDLSNQRYCQHRSLKRQRSCSEYCPPYNGMDLAEHFCAGWTDVSNMHNSHRDNITDS